MRASAVRAIKDVVLVGGGHSHIEVMRRFAMRPVADIRLTLVADEVHTPYSGMFPGLVAGHFQLDEVHIDLDRLAVATGARLIRAAANGLDLAGQHVLLDGRPPLAFDVVSLNIGSTPMTAAVPGASLHAIPVKPWPGFLRGWDRLRRRALAADRRFRLVVVGGGAGGVELALSMQFRLQRELGLAERASDGLEVMLLTADDALLSGHNRRAQRIFEHVFRQRRIGARKGARAVAVEPRRVIIEDGRSFPFDALVWATDGGGAPWLQGTGLALDELGFVQVEATLRSTSHERVFAAGDTATVVAYPRPKSGVFAVRQGPPLAANLRLTALGRRPRPFHPQQHFLSLVTTGDRDAVASRGPLALRARILWRWKRRIDRRFVQRYAGIEVPTPASDPSAFGQPDLRSDTARLGPHAPAAGASPQPGPTRYRVFLPRCLDDPFVFGEIAAQHALSQAYALRAEPRSAEAIVVTPSCAHFTQADLRHWSAGAREACDRAAVRLTWTEPVAGPESGLGFWVTVRTTDDAASAVGLRLGQMLVLTKALGTGVLLEARRRGIAEGRWIELAIASMRCPNGPAAAILRAHRAAALSCVAGLGVGWHLQALLRRSGLAARLDVGALPTLPGVTGLLRAGVSAAAMAGNRAALPDFANEALLPDALSPNLLFDPQVSGGLLAVIEQEKAEVCLAALRAGGAPAAALIGRTAPMRQPDPLAADRPQRSRDR